MYQNYQTYEYLQKIHTLIERQNNKIKQLEKEIEKIQAEIKVLREKPTTIEYKFDQLKVETLSGTLNIGLSPYSDNIEDFSVNNVEENFLLEEKYIKLMDDIEVELKSYLNNEAIDLIKQAAKKHSKLLDNAYYQLIIGDISKQLSQRIQLYINKLDRNMSIDNEEEIRNSIIKKIKQDINVAIDLFLKHLPERK